MKKKRLLAAKMFNLLQYFHEQYLPFHDYGSGKKLSFYFRKNILCKLNWSGKNTKGQVSKGTSELKTKAQKESLAVSVLVLI